jgi:hypothetical protein
MVIPSQSVASFWEAGMAIQGLMFLDKLSMMRCVSVGWSWEETEFLRAISQGIGLKGK